MDAPASASSSFIVTNQRGVARGIMKMEDGEEIHLRMKEELAEAGASINGVYICPHNDEDDCRCRKPKPGLLYRAAHDHHLNTAKAIMIGDEERDVEAGEEAGCRTILLDVGKTL